jgi:hypothetical protein
MLTDWNTQYLSLQNTGHSITCNLEISQNIHLKKTHEILFKQALNLLFLALMSFIKMFGMKC